MCKAKRRRQHVCLLQNLKHQVLGRHGIVLIDGWLVNQGCPKWGRGGGQALSEPTVLINVQTKKPVDFFSRLKFTYYH